MLRSFIYTFVLSIGLIFTGYNIKEYNKSFDNCEKLLVEVKSNLNAFKNELQTLNQAMGVDYE